MPVGRDADGDRYLIVDEYLPRDTTLGLWERATGVPAGAAAALPGHIRCGLPHPIERRRYLLSGSP